MLIVRRGQIEALRLSALQQFENRMVVHLKKFFSTHCAALGEDKTRVLIQYGIERAATYGIVTERGICKFIDLMLALGVEFDKDPKLPWVTQILDQSLSPNAKIDTLYNAGLRHLSRAPSSKPRSEG